jgi:hypothetical protein
MVKQMAESIWNIPEGAKVGVKHFPNANYPIDLDGIVTTTVDDTFAVEWEHEGVKTCRVVRIHVTDYPCGAQL